MQEGIKGMVMSVYFAIHQLIFCSTLDEGNQPFSFIFQRHEDLRIRTSKLHSEDQIAWRRLSVTCRSELVKQGGQDERMELYSRTTSPTHRLKDTKPNGPVCVCVCVLLQKGSHSHNLSGTLAGS